MGLLLMMGWRRFSHFINKPFIHFSRLVIYFMSTPYMRPFVQLMIPFHLLENSRLNVKLHHYYNLASSYPTTTITGILLLSSSSSTDRFKSFDFNLSIQSESIHQLCLHWFYHNREIWRSPRPTIAPPNTQRFW